MCYYVCICIIIEHVFGVRSAILNDGLECASVRCVQQPLSSAPHIYIHYQINYNTVTKTETGLNLSLNSELFIFLL